MTLPRRAGRYPDDMSRPRGGLGPEWWREGVLYQIYPRSYQDSNGDGIGDLRGITQRLDHLAGRHACLGIDGIWISPFSPSPMAGFGYDVADYCGVDPQFGTLADFDELLEQAHARGIRIIVDLVPNHTSDQHPWFVESRSSRTNSKRDWYVWADPKPDGSPPNAWRSVFSRVKKEAWTLDPKSGQYYLHSFLPQQPDLNWWNPEVRQAFEGILRFWLDRGADAFRDRTETFERVLPKGSWPDYTLSNHDNPRAVSRYAGGDMSRGRRRGRLAALMLLTLRGTPFIYYGEEIGMADAPIPGDRVVDVAGRDPERTPMQWDSSATAGFTNGDPWLPVNPETATVNVDA